MPSLLPVIDDLFGQISERASGRFEIGHPAGEQHENSPSERSPEQGSIVHGAGQRTGLVADDDRFRQARRNDVPKLLCAEQHAEIVQPMSSWDDVTEFQSSEERGEIVGGHQIFRLAGVGCPSPERASQCGAGEAEFDNEFLHRREAEHFDERIRCDIVAHDRHQNSQVTERHRGRLGQPAQDPAAGRDLIGGDPHAGSRIELLAGEGAIESGQRQEFDRARGHDGTVGVVRDFEILVEVAKEEHDAGRHLSDELLDRSLHRRAYPAAPHPRQSWQYTVKDERFLVEGEPCVSER